MLWNPLVGWFTNLGNLGWTNALESLYNWWVELVVLEALAGKMLWKPWKAWMETNLTMVFGDVWPWGGIIVWWVEVGGLWKPSMSFYWCVLWDPTFMLGIWHGHDWLKRYLAQPIYGRVECGSPITSRFIAFINEKVHSLDFHVQMYWCIYGFWWLICLLYLCSYYVVYMHIYPGRC